MTETIPSIRFNEFSGSYKFTPLGELSELVTSGSRDWAQYYSGSGSKFIRMTNLPKSGIELNLDDLKYVNIGTDGSDGRRTSLYEGDVLISITAELGKIGWIPPNFGEAYINQHTALVRLNSDVVDSRFVAHALSSAKNNKAINRLNDAGAKAGLNLPTIRSFTLWVPSKPEQQKIADFLSAVDTRIQQLKQKQQLLQAFNKGLMQQLFSQTLRFKDDHGNPFPDWEERLVSNVAQVIGGGTPESSNKSLWGGSIQWFTPSELGRKYVSCSKRTITETGLKTSSAKLIPAGSLLFSSRATVGDVSIARNECSTNQGFQSFIVNADNSNEFVYYWILQNKKRFLRKAQGSTFLEISGGEIRKMKILLPTKQEQTKIANALAAMDKKIDAVAQQITHTQTFKQGLLQQMFV